DERFTGPAFGYDLLGLQAARQQSADSLESRAPILMALHAKLGLIQRMSQRLAEQGPARPAPRALGMLGMDTHGENHRPLRERPFGQCEQRGDVLRSEAVVLAVGQRQDADDVAVVFFAFMCE